MRKWAERVRRKRNIMNSLEKINNEIVRKYKEEVIHKMILFSRGRVLETIFENK
jgi:hypothetical protein